jgi:hypothetical protein
MEMPREHFVILLKMFYLYLAMIRHLYHGIHLEVRQFKMTKHVLAGHFLDAFVIITYQPWCYDHITFLEPIIHYLDVGYVSSPFG